MAEEMQPKIKQMLRGIDRYNPDNLEELEFYIDRQSEDNYYDIEANLAVLKLYQFNPKETKKTTVVKILLKALTALPNTDFVLCKCLIDSQLLEDDTIKGIQRLHELLETCHFEVFWKELLENPLLYKGIVGFEDSIRKFICHVIQITYQTIKKTSLSVLLGDLADNDLKHWMSVMGWKDGGIGDNEEAEKGLVFVTNQEENIKTKNITEKIDLENVAQVIAAYR
ncbi:eukaryotic translation initiation factor 3 subunit K-like [Oppia nitens]|uniref:eukaryotic translation initiation factor 3 subunit K-like n=1 Tax=Oppia nitens TaxID=1686743 RepID=UPI0023DC9FDD|nr:eukaryotic translation initiation factor 3 subunit K-like [Oppia nitens]